MFNEGTYSVYKLNVSVVFELFLKKQLFGVPVYFLAL